MPKRANSIHTISAFNTFITVVMKQSGAEDYLYAHIVLRKKVTGKVPARNWINSQPEVLQGLAYLSAIGL